MRHRRTTLSALAAAILTVATLTAAAPATAESSSHCAIGTDPLVEAAQPVEVTCFETEEELWQFLTGAPLEQQSITGDAILRFNAEIAADGAELSASGPLLALDVTATAAASVLLGIEYDGTGYSGASKAFYGSSGTGCSSGATYGFPNLGSYGWNDRTSSATSYAGCRGQHYQDAGYASGSVASVTCSPNCSSMGLMNNQTSSIVYRR
jgi:hypothetical protein